MHLDPQRVYSSYGLMIETERSLPADRRADFIVIVTPNHLHYDPALMALESGFHVIVDKPLAFSVREAKSLREAVEKAGSIAQARRSCFMI